MTKYREILRLTALGLSQRNIVQSISVSQKTVVKVQKRTQECIYPSRWMKPWQMQRLRHWCFPRNQRYPNKNGCWISTISRRSYSATVSTRNSSGRSTWRNAASLAISHSCIPSSVIISSRMSRGVERPCISTESPASRSKLTGQEILHKSPSGYRRDHPRISVCGCHDIQPVSLRWGFYQWKAALIDYCARSHV